MTDGIVGPNTWASLVGGGFLPIGTPDDASRHLYASWIAGDREAALQAATEGAVNTLFGFTPGPPERFQFSGCSSHEGQMSCFYYQEGDGMNMLLEGGASAGWRVNAVNFVAD